MELNRFWVAVMEVGFVGYLGSLVAVTWFGCTPEGRVRWKPLAGTAALAVCFFILWVLGLHFA